MYSANRLLAFDEYCKRASLTRIFLVLLLFCIPAVILMIIFDSVPLQNLSEGWQANVMYWLRISVESAVIGIALVIQLPSVVSEIVFTSKQLVMITVGIVIGHTDALMLLAEYRKFPVPFMYTVGSVPLMTIFAAFILITQGTAGDRTGIKKYIKFANLCSIQTVMLVVHPVYNAIFVSLEGHSQMAFVLLLPLIKHSIKHISAQADSEYDDLVTAFSASVGFFDALYMTKCMQSAGPLIVVDMAQNYMARRGLARQTRTLKTAKKYAEIRENRTSSQISPDVLRWAADILIKTDNCD